jgi:carboxypeptidase C (cathepsin A)
MRRQLAQIATVLIVCAVSGMPAARQDTPDDRIVTTKHEVVVDGRTLSYTARAGRLPIRDNETGDVHGQMFFVSYTLERTSQSPRPITFAWNGGPGSSSSLVHLLGFGPKVVQAGSGVVPNRGTWLDFTDLVFVDPIGTGYSRPTKAEYGKEFYQTRGDAESVAEFIRVYRNRFEAWDAPLFLAGESFGVRRAAGVADVLQRRRIPLNGVILIGLALPLGELTDALRTALLVPTYTAAAFVHKKLPSDLQKDMPAALAQSEKWAETEYAAALAKRDELTDADRKRVLGQLARFTGLDPSALDAKTLTIGMPQFTQRLLRDRQLVVGRYDSRLTGPLNLKEEQYDPTNDPSLKDIIDNVGVLRYLKHHLKYENDLPYQGPFGGGWPAPTGSRGDWMSVKWAWEASERGGSGSTQPLRAAMTANPQLKVFVSCGYYDLVCSYAGNAYVAAHLEPSLKANVVARAYGGAHAIYTDETAKLALKRDVAQFVEQSRGAPASSAAPRETASGSDEQIPADQVVTTKHRVTVGGNSLTYTARAGLLPIRHNETGEARAHVFFVAYALDRQANAPPRPLTFLWNGGPGSNSTLVHLVGFGPKRLKTADDATAPPTCECEFEDNQTTWLDKTDLVFVDPVGTGFSRPTKAEYAADFYSTLKDIASIAEFVRTYLTRFDAWDAPLFIGGESYGVWRAAGVAEALERRGQRVAGVIFISGGIPVGPVVSDEMRTALFVPTRTASAFFHKRLTPDLQADLQRTLRMVETWARDEYAPALARRDSLTDAERQAIVEQLARFTAADPAQIDRTTLRLERQQFAEQLLKDRNQVLARFDTRLTTSAPAAGAPRGDAISRYLRTELKFTTDLAYQGIETGYAPQVGEPRRPVGSRWDYDQGPRPPANQPAEKPTTPPRPVSTDAPPGGSQPWLGRALAINPRLKTFVAAGLYDSLNSCAANAYLVTQLEPQAARNFTTVCYDGGHMMYDGREARLKLKQDVAAFIDSASTLAKER